MKVDQAINEINNHNFAPVYLILGEEKYFHDQIRHALKESVVEEDSRDLNEASYNMEEVLIDRALEDAESFPFFGDQRLVMVDAPYFLTTERAKAKLVHDVDWLQSYIENPSPTTVLAIFAPYEKLDGRKKITKILKKEAVIIEAQALNEREMKRYLYHDLTNSGYKIGQDAIDLLTHRVQNQLTIAMNELTKLKIYLGDQKEIGEDLVSQIVSLSPEENVFQLIDLLMSGKTGPAIQFYRDLLHQNEEPIRLNALLISQFRLYLQVKILSKQGYSENDITKALKAHPFRIKKALQASRQLNFDKLSRAYQSLVDSDYRMKTGQGDRELEFEWFALKLNQE